MAEEFYSFTIPDGTTYALPKTARPGGDWGESYDLQLGAGTHANTFFVAGTGKPLPSTLELVMELETETETGMEALVSEIVRYARAATLLRRLGGTATEAGFTVAQLMGLSKYGRQPLQADNSVAQQLTLTLLRAAPDQVGFAGDQVVSGTQGTSGVAVEGVTVTGIETVRTEA